MFENFQKKMLKKEYCQSIIISRSGLKIKGKEFGNRKIKRERESQAKLRG